MKQIKDFTSDFEQIISDNIRLISSAIQFLWLEFDLVRVIKLKINL